MKTREQLAKDFADWAVSKMDDEEGPLKIKNQIHMNCETSYLVGFDKAIELASRIIYLSKGSNDPSYNKILDLLEEEIKKLSKGGSVSDNCKKCKRHLDPFMNSTKPGGLCIQCEHESEPKANRSVATTLTDWISEQEKICEAATLPPWTTDYPKKDGCLIDHAGAEIAVTTDTEFFSSSFTKEQDKAPSDKEYQEAMSKEPKPEIKHPWWHKIFENWYRTKSYRDGFLGNRLTPDVDYHYYNCSWPGCKWEKEVREVL